MFNLQGSEIIFILLIALVVLGPEKLPGAIRRVTSLYAELRKLSTGFQTEFKSVLDEPLREMKSTADLVKHAADPKWIADEAEREAALEAAAEKKAKQSRDSSWAMRAAGAAHLAEVASEPADEKEPEVDAFADPVDDIAGDVGDDRADVVDDDTVADDVETDLARDLDSDLETDPDADLETDPDAAVQDEETRTDSSSAEIGFEQEEKSA